MITVSLSSLSASPTFNLPSLRWLLDHTVNPATVFVNYSTCDDGFSVQEKGATAHELPDSSQLSLSAFLTGINCFWACSPLQADTQVS